MLSSYKLPVSHSFLNVLHFYLASTWEKSNNFRSASSSGWKKLCNFKICFLFPKRYLKATFLLACNSIIYAKFCWWTHEMRHFLESMPMLIEALIFSAKGWSPASTRSSYKCLTGFCWASNVPCNQMSNTLFPCSL